MIYDVVSRGSVVTVQPPVSNQLPSTSSGNDSQPELVEGVVGLNDYGSVSVSGCSPVVIHWTSMPGWGLA